MKTFNKLQNELLQQARWDGGYPKAIFMGGLVALVQSKKEEDSLINCYTNALKISALFAFIVIFLVLALLTWGK
jgi:hypothetical protein